MIFSNRLKAKGKNGMQKTTGKKDMNNHCFRIFTAMKNVRKRKMTRPASKEDGNWAERRRDHFVFFICLVLATSFWLLIKFSDVYSVSYPLYVKYINIPKGRLVTSLEDSTVIIHFKSNGYNLLDLLIHRQLDTLYVNMKKCTVKRDSGNKYVVLTSSLREDLAQELGVNDRDLVFSKPELAFHLEYLHKIRVKVIPKLDLTFRSQYRLYGDKIVPRRVTVYGPKKMLDTLKVIHTGVIHLENLAGNKTTVAGLQNPNPKLLKIYPSQVKIYLEVEKYTEETVKIPVDVSEIKPAIRTFPLKVTVNFNVFIRDYEKVRPEQFKVVPDVKNIDLTRVRKLRLELVAKPKIVSNVRLVPPEVEFIIIK